MISYLFIFSQVPALVSKNHRLLQEAVLYNSKNQRLCKQPVIKFFPIFQLILNLLCISLFICRMGGHNKNTALIDLCGFSQVAYIRLSIVPSIQEGLHQCQLEFISTIPSLHVYIHSPSTVQSTHPRLFHLLSLINFCPSLDESISPSPLCSGISFADCSF